MDQSTLLFVAPPTRETLPTAAKVREQAEAVSINFVTDPSGDPRKILAEQARELEQLDAGLRVLDEGPFTCGLGEGWSYVQRLTLQSVPVRQLVVACSVGPLTVVATAAAPDSRFEGARERLAAVLASLGPAGEAP